ncbi:MAG TPA: hypothetical protein VM241_04285 [Candidatus Thermoplasmatota archaeon]|nr:hypothetical protein [Candidatus Thermoplasmatota archaeon]
MAEPTRTLVPIVRLSGRIAETELPEGGRLRPLRDDEKTWLAAGQGFFEGGWAVHMASYCLEFPGADGYGPEPGGRRHATAAAFVSALRMTGDGEPGYACVYDASATAQFSRTWSASYDIPEEGDVLRADDGMIADTLQLMGA